MRCPQSERWVCEDCEGSKLFEESDDDGQEYMTTCPTCDGTGTHPGGHRLACDWCYPTHKRDGVQQFALHADVEDVIRADVMRRVPENTQRFIVALYELGALVGKLVVVHEDLAVFLVRDSHESAVTELSKADETLNVSRCWDLDDPSSSSWFRVALTRRFALADVEAEVARVIAGRSHHAAA